MRLRLIVSALTVVGLLGAVSVAAQSGSENNPVITAINQGVTALRDAIADAVAAINAHTDTAVQGSGQNSIVFAQGFTLPGSPPVVEQELLPPVAGTTYSGHVTLVMTGSQGIILTLRAGVGGAVVPLGTADTLSATAVTEVINIDFAGEELNFSLFNTRPVAGTDTVSVFATVHYVTATNVVNVQ